MDELIAELERIAAREPRVSAPHLLDFNEAVAWRAGYRAGMQLMQDEIRRVINAARKSKRQVADDDTQPSA